MHEKDKKILIGLGIGFGAFVVVSMWALIIFGILFTSHTIKTTGTFESFAEFEAIELENCVSGEGFTGSELVSDRSFFNAEKYYLENAGFTDENAEDYPQSYGMIWEKDGEKVSLAAYIFDNRADAGWYYMELTGDDPATIGFSSFTSSRMGPYAHHYAVIHKNTVYHMASTDRELLREFKEIVNTALLEE